MAKKSLKKNLFVFFFFIAITLIVFSLDQGAFLDGFKKTVFNFTRPVFKTTSSFSRTLTRPVMLLINLEKKQQALTDLNQTKKELIALKVKYEELEKENEFLKEAVSLSKKKEAILIAAEVIGRIDESGGEIMIDAGADQGIAQGQPVVLADYFLIGRVEQAWPTASQIRLINNKNFKVSVRGQDSKTEGLLTGGSDKLSVEIYNHQDKPIIGEYFLTSGLDNTFPPGLIIGQLKEVDEKPTAILRMGEIEISDQLNHLQRVLILKND